MAHHLILPVGLVAVVSLLAPRAAGYPWPVCGSSGNYLANSSYLPNIKTIGATLPKNASTSPGLFATAQIGTVPDQVWALALCRGDGNASSCLNCLNQAFEDLPSACAYTKDATIYYDSCVLHYSNIHFRASDDTAYTKTYRIRNNFNATEEQRRSRHVVAGLITTTPERAKPARFRRGVVALMNATADYAAYNSTRLYASGEAEFDQKLPKVYSWAQCTPDLSPARCRHCLGQIMEALPRLFTDAIGARVLGIRCSYRYETKSFFDGPVMVQQLATSNTSGTRAPPVVPNTVTPVTATGEGRKYSVPGIVLIILLPTIAVINLMACVVVWRRRRPLAQAKQPCYSTEGEDIESIDSMLIDISTLRTTTGNFAETNKLGEGGFGAVYKGTLPDGDEIAVKRLSTNSTQGVEELKNELALVAKLKHKNLVRLVGVCLEQQERLLVYEFIPNRSLDLILFDDIADTEKREQLDWGRRYKIINGIARGLQYLHEDSQLKVVHRDLKASNILLDTNMNPKISDFGLARLFRRDQTQGVTNRVVGTYGYIAPEYMMHGNYSVKSDVFSFGVMVLEIVTGRKNNDYYNSGQSEDLLTTIWEHWTVGTVLEMMDGCMSSSFSERDVLRCIHVGLLCVQGNPADRPVMSSVVMMLGSNTVSLSTPSKPAFYAKNAGANLGVASNVSTMSVQDGPGESI